MASAESVKVGDAHQPRPAGRDHCGSCGRRSTPRISVRARAPEHQGAGGGRRASHARAMLPASAASRRMLRGARRPAAPRWRAGRAPPGIPREARSRQSRSRTRAAARSNRASADGAEPASALMSSSAALRRRDRSSGGVIDDTVLAEILGAAAPSDRAPGCSRRAASSCSSTIARACHRCRAACRPAPGRAARTSASSRSRPRTSAARALVGQPVRSRAS